MPDEMSHLNLANHNQDPIADLLPKIDQHSDWITTVAFYRALHVVEAVFAGDPAVRHGIDHPHRDQALKRSKRYEKIYRHYRPLYAASMAARYMQDGVSHFSVRFSSRRVVDEILRHHLHQVESSALGFLKTPAALRSILDLWRPADIPPA